MKPRVSTTPTPGRPHGAQLPFRDDQSSFSHQGGRLRGPRGLGRPGGGPAPTRHPGAPTASERLLTTPCPAGTPRPPPLLLLSPCCSPSEAFPPQKPSCGPHPCPHHVPSLWKAWTKLFHTPWSTCAVQSAYEGGTATPPTSRGSGRPGRAPLALLTAMSHAKPVEQSLGVPGW